MHCEALKDLTDSIMEMLEFFLLSMDDSDNNLLKKFLQSSASKYSHIMRTISTEVVAVLIVGEDETQYGYYRLALAHAQQSRGFSLQSYLFENQELAEKLQFYLILIKAINEQFQEWKSAQSFSGVQFPLAASQELEEPCECESPEDFDHEEFCRLLEDPNTASEQGDGNLPPGPLTFSPSYSPSSSSSAPAAYPPEPKQPSAPGARPKRRPVL